MSFKKNKVVILGPIPPPYMGPSIATEIILKSKLNTLFTLIHIDTNVHEEINTMGKWKIRTLVANIPKYLLMIKIIIKEKPVLVLIPISQTTRGFVKDSLFIIISKVFSIRILLQLRGSNFLNWFNSSSFIVKHYIMRILKLSNGIIVLGEKIKPQFLNFFSENRIYVVPNGADYIIPLSERRADKLRLLYLSNLQASKGIDDIIQALLILRTNQCDNFELNIAGTWRDENHKSNLINFVNKNKLPVIFHSTLVGEEKLHLLSQSDVFVFPPREPEGHPWVIIEAMAAGLPIVSTDQGAITESVIDGVNGFIVPTRCPEHIAAKIAYLIEYPEIRKQMGEASRRLYLENFTEEKLVLRMAYVFNTVLASTKSY